MAEMNTNYREQFLAAVACVSQLEAELTRLRAVDPEYSCCQCCDGAFRHPLSITSHSTPCRVHHVEATPKSV